MTEYRIATSSNRNNHPSPKGLEDEVAALIAQGFAPHGSPFIFKEAICQAMIKLSGANSLSGATMEAI